MTPGRAELVFVVVGHGVFHECPAVTELVVLDSEVLLGGTAIAELLVLGPEVLREGPEVAELV